VKLSESPYLKNRRLEDIIAAIQAMGVNPWAGSKDWGKKLGDPLSADTWDAIFSQHPEFFRRSEGWATLRWRYTYDKTYNAPKHRDLSAEEINQLTPDEKENLTHKPLTADQIETLIKTAIELHSRAIAYQEEMRWWKPVWISGLLAVLGALIGALATFGGVYLTYLASRSP
jgi:hypothetical protein